MSAGKKGFGQASEGNLSSPKPKFARCSPFWGWIFFGAFIGWLSSRLMGKQSGGCLVNVALGLVGALAGGFLFRALSGSFDYDQHGVVVGTLVAVVGAIIVLAVWNAVTDHCSWPLR